MKETCSWWQVSNNVLPDIYIDLFQENIFFVPVSKTPNLKAIVHEVFHHKGDQVPEFQSDEEAINQLEQLLSQIGEPTLLILDDVWSGSESQLLERFEFPTPNYKILVTSGSTLPRFSFTYKLKPSYNVHAMALFRRSTTLQDGSSLVPDEEIVDKVPACHACDLNVTVHILVLVH